jgi:hypothetical protein
VLTRPPAPAGRDRTGEAGWTIASLSGPHGSADTTVALAAAALQRDCPWPLVAARDLEFAAPITGAEAHLLSVLDPTGTYRHRAG